MKMLAPVAGQSFNLSTGGQYFADEHRVIHDVDRNDVGELRRVGCVELPDDAPTMSTIAPEPIATDATELFGYTNFEPDAETEPKVDAEHAE